MKRHLCIAYTIIVDAVLGTVVPFFVQQRELAKERTLELIVCGVLIMASGIAFLAIISASSGHENRDAGTRYAKELIDRDAAAAILDRKRPFSHIQNS